MLPRRLDSLPFDVFYQIAISLDDRDCVHLSRTNRALYELMDSDLITRKIVEEEFRYSKEARSALALGYRKALGHRFDINEAVATAAPYSASVLAYGGSDFLYHQGFLCYRAGHEIRLLNVHGAGRLERVLDLHTVLPRLESAASVDSVHLLHYSHGILVCQVEGSAQDTLLAIHMARRPSPQKQKSKPGRLLLHRSLPASSSIFVRHSGSYLWYGILAPGGWRVQGVDLATQKSIDFPLDQILDGDLGQSLCFEIYQDHLYAVSTQVAFAEEERFSSFYHWFCYAPRIGPKGNGRLWRREHREGPINEMWTDLSIRTDESTGRPVILECRREWPDGKSENHRTYYTEPLPTPEEAYSDGAAPSSTWMEADDDLKESSSKGPLVNRQPYDQRPEKRLRRNYHAEYESNDSAQRQEFIAARTKFSGYHLAASTFIDLVNDPVSDGLRSRDRLRLRTNSRKRKCPVDEETGLLFRPTQSGFDVPAEGSEERFTSRGVHLWPADDAPSELHRILCPDSRTGAIRAICDERSLIYSVPCTDLLPEYSAPDHRALLLINFDPKIRFPGLIAPGTTPPPETEKIFAKLQPTNGSIVRDAEPLYKTINWGYWLR
ncbi:hypothetical protein N7492_006701 [Penicillium capsulatum]|uniref:F-box domain-containing protein n=1 Tax=Penicillium capsulatum TaxID=69766 RepID=A0A9W9HYE5_9EURO|nr:hypothetical protein N7492_006701 [Penicillium capsulatum]KAJ6116537.1 hypothetical protein N7512_006262 [Penicillium capsulatum]